MTTKTNRLLSRFNAFFIELKAVYTLFILTLILLCSAPLTASAIDGEINYSGTNTELTGDDISAGPFNLGFTFSYYGTDYTQAYVNINGTITFGSNFAQYSNNALNAAGADNTIYAFWDDLNTNKSGTSGNKPIYYTTIGEAPNRKFIAQWTDIYFHGTTVQLGTFQIILYEGTNEISLQYRDLLGGSRALGDSATVGIKKNSSTYKQYSNNTASLTQGQSIKYTPNGVNDYTVNASSSYDLVYILPTGAPVSPTLVNPTDGTTGVTLRPTFEWLPVASSTSYTVLVSTQSNFSSTVVNAANVVGTSYTPGSDLSASTQYYWRVQSVNSFGGSLSSTRTFTTGSANVAPDSPASTTSSTFLGGVSTSDVTGGTISMNLSDPDASEQVRYRLQIATDSGFSSLAIDYRSPFGNEGDATYTFGESGGTYLVGTATSTLSPGNYYVRIRAEDDAAASSDWTTSGSVAFSVAADTTAPIISEVSVAELASTTALIQWTTNEQASSRIEFGPSSDYGTTTATYNTSPRVTSHSVLVEGLSPCITYNYRIHSADAASNTATTSAASFTTKGCTAEALVVTESVSTSVSTSTGGTVSLSQGGKGVTLDVPTSFASTSGRVYFQIKKIDEDTVTGAVGKPSSNLNPISDHTYALNAITEGLVPVISFDTPLTITISYNQSDVQGINETTLQIYRWNGSTWNALSDCSVDITNKTVTCTTDHFSTFTLFGQATSNTTTSSGNSGTSLSFGSETVQAQVYNLLVIGNITRARELYTTWKHLPFDSAILRALGASVPTVVAASQNISNASTTATLAKSVSTSTNQNTTTTTYTFTRNLSLGMTGEDVKTLQKFLNANGFIIASTGPGSIGNETTMFGSLTKKALTRYQIAKNIKPAIGYFGSVTRASVSK